MVQVIHVVRTADDIGYPGYSPLIHIHHVERSVFGNGIAIHIYGEMRIAAKEVVYARELMLNTIQTLTLTPETGTHTPYHAQKYIYHKGEFGNYASVDIFTVVDGVELAVDAGPDEGSVWLDFEALGE